MKHTIRKINQDWLRVCGILLGFVLIVYPYPFAKFLHWILGGGFFIYSVIRLIQGVTGKAPSVSIGDSLIKAILSIVIILQQDDATPIIGVIWAMQSLNEAGLEIDDFIRTRKFSLINMIILIVSVILSILLMIDPFEHMTLHIRFVGVEIITTLILSMNNRID